MADEETNEAPPAKEKGGMAVTAILIFVAMLAAQVLSPLLTKMIYGDPNAEPEPEPEAVVVEAEEEVPFEKLGPAIYVPLDPPLLASFDVKGEGTRYLQMSVQAMGRNQNSMDAVRTHAPALRNAFLFLMSHLTYADVQTAEGKEELRQEMLTAAQGIMQKNIGDPGIEEIYFTSLIVQ
jgi:flagellar protein FliL